MTLGPRGGVPVEPVLPVSDEDMKEALAQRCHELDAQVCSLFIMHVVDS